MTSLTQEETYKVEPLQGSANYRTWKFSMKMVLQAKDLWEVVSGEEAKPDTEKAGQAWEKKARKALATIALALSAAEKEHVIDCTTPKEAWDILEKLYEGKGRNRKFMLLRELFRESMGTKGMDGYLRSVKEKVSELSRIGTSLDKDVKLAIVFNGLPEEYRYLVVAFESQELEKIDLDELTARFLEEEARINSGEYSTIGRPTALFSKAKKFEGDCHYCGQKGHWKRDCPIRKFREESDGKAAAKSASSQFSM